MCIFEFTKSYIHIIMLKLIIVENSKNMKGINMTLHEAMQLVLKENDRPMTARELADEINNKNLYTRKDRKPVPTNQIGARAKNYPDIFEKKEMDGRIHFLLRK